jgi:iron complex outermembrane receptor protein
MRHLLLGGLSLLALVPATAFAQADPAPADASTTGAADPAAVRSTQASPDPLSATRSGEILVTARRRTETAQAVPLAISVIRGDSIEATGNFNVVKLQQLAPTLQVYTTNPRNTSVNIRGLGVPFGLTSDGFEQGVGIYVDDVYNSRVAAATFDFLDVAQVEVLRGPQGTLYGKNTTAGAINITTNQRGTQRRQPQPETGEGLRLRPSDRHGRGAHRCRHHQPARALLQHGVRSVHQRAGQSRPARTIAVQAK